MDILTNKILPLFDKSGKSDMELERDIGLPRSIIYDWRNGRSKSYKKYLVEISNYFGVSAESLSGNEQKNKPTTERDELNQEINDLFNQLSHDKKIELLEYARYKVEHQSK